MEWTDVRRKRNWIIRCSICHRFLGYDTANIKNKDCVLEFASENGIYDNERHFSDVLDRHKERHDHLKEADEFYTEEFFRKSRIKESGSLISEKPIIIPTVVRIGIKTNSMAM